jgi:hypothetical protein
MAFSRPSYELLGVLNELELGVYIQKKYAEYKKGH